MVGQKDQRPVARDVFQLACGNIKAQAIAFDHHLPEIPTGGDLVFITCGLLDQPDAPVAFSTTRTKAWAGRDLTADAYEISRTTEFRMTLL